MQWPLPLERANLAASLGPGLAERWVSDAHHRFTLAEMLCGSLIAGKTEALAGRNVLLALESQIETAQALLELDGLANRLLLLPPDLSADHDSSLIADAGIDAVITTWPSRFAMHGLAEVIQPSWTPWAAGQFIRRRQTEWLMLTSGTTGRPKIVAHTLNALTGAIETPSAKVEDWPVWSTFYDIRRYGGLQIFLRAMLGGSLTLSDPDESTADFLKRCTKLGVTHISGTPSHWRKALMSDVIAGFMPSYVRLSGEIADQAVLDGLSKAFPKASIGHAYASTEAGVGFAVEDGLAGFPASLLEGAGQVELKVVDGVLHIRSARAASRYLGANASQLLDQAGFVNTGDIVEQRGNRYHFVGRVGGIMNVGGLKVHPEEVETVLNAHPAVQMARARARKSPITGSVVVADVVLRENSATDLDALKSDIIASCRSKLPAHKVPVLIALVPTIEVSANGKLVRAHA